jgi:hypothetical protein
VEGINEGKAKLGISKGKDYRFGLRLRGFFLFVNPAPDLEPSLWLPPPCAFGLERERVARSSSIAGSLKLPALENRRKAWPRRRGAWRSRWPASMISVDFDVIRIVEHCLTGRRNVSHDDAEGDMQGLYTTENLFQVGPKVATVLHFQP